MSRKSSGRSTGRCRSRRRGGRRATRIRALSSAGGKAPVTSRSRVRNRGITSAVAAKFQNGTATIEVPEDFRIVTDTEGLSVQVTPIGEFANVAVVRIELDGIVVKASKNVEFFFTVNGVRRTHKDLRPIGAGNEFMPRNADAKIPAYLTDAQKAMLISNGTYKEGGTVNLDTARQLGWDRIWAERERASQPK